MDDFDILSAVVVEDYLIDLVSPQVIITDPPDLASVNQLFEVSGTAADPDGSGVANLRVQITDGSFYVTSDGSGLTSRPQ